MNDEVKWNYQVVTSFFVLTSSVSKIMFGICSFTCKQELIMLSSDSQSVSSSVCLDVVAKNSLQLLRVLQLISQTFNGAGPFPPAARCCKNSFKFAKRLFADAFS
uniref:Uncharacterized protein n=1 Tax=Glossina palpalis gambiensis TaxID=67801 RepID=A0A1B0ATK0_9MUSC